jgi:hypothetical protein
MTLHATTPGGLSLGFRANMRVRILAGHHLLGLLDTVTDETLPLDTDILVCPGCGDWSVQLIAPPSVHQTKVGSNLYAEDRAAADALAWEHLDECEPLAMLAGLSHLQRPKVFPFAR